MMLSRRNFMATTAELVTAAMMPAPIRTRQRASSPQRILIAGAGAAGLAAGFELQRLGHDVLVFEPRAIPGGRILTLRAPFADGLYAEAGAMYLPNNGEAAEYAREFGLELVPLAFRADLGAVAYVAGQRVVVHLNTPVSWPVPLGPDEVGLSIGTLHRRYHRTRITLDGLAAPDWPHPTHLPYDDISLAEFWRRNGASPGAIRLMRLRYFDAYGDGIESVSALQLMREFSILSQSTGAVQIRGGNDRLPRALAERLPGKIRYGSRVVAVRHDVSSVELTIEDRAGRHQVRGDRLIVTLPPPPLRSVQFTPPLSEKRQRAIREITTTVNTRVFLQCRERFWERDGVDGSADTDLPIRQVYHSTVTQPGTRGILETYTYGTPGLDLARRSPDERVSFVLAEVAKVHPRLPEYVEGGTSYSWDHDPFALGGHVAFKPGQIREFFPFLRQPEGRIHFAGDWVGGLPGYVQGALASARGVVQSLTS